jgi:hypothetical protein
MICDFDTTIENFVMITRAIASFIIALMGAQSTTAMMVTTLNDFLTRNCATAALMGTKSIAAMMGDYNSTLK